MILQILAYMWVVAFFIAVGSWSGFVWSMLGHIALLAAVTVTVATYKVAEKRLRKIKWFSIFSGFFIPFFLIFSYSYFFENIFLCLFAVLLSFTGMLAERWLFFAEAKHVVNLYHGAQKC